MTGPIVVTGGTGTLGRPVVEGLLRSGSTVRVASRRAHPDRDLAYQWAQVDYRSESSTRAAMASADTVVHCANSMRRVLDDQVVRAAVRAEVAHFVYISIVGIDRIPFRYYQNKLATERQLEASVHDPARHAVPRPGIPVGRRAHQSVDRAVAGRLAGAAGGGRRGG